MIKYTYCTTIDGPIVDIGLSEKKFNQFLSILKNKANKYKVYNKKVYKNKGFIVEIDLSNSRQQRVYTVNNTFKTFVENKNGNNFIKEHSEKTLRPMGEIIVFKSVDDEYKLKQHVFNVGQDIMNCNIQLKNDDKYYSLEIISNSESSETIDIFN